ncbi:hypothetical protein RB213_008573 [Colletotrichum asianum]
MIPGVVTTELGDFPINSKFAGTSSPQVLAKTAEELFKMQVPQMNVMGFFCPLMTFGEEFPLPTAITRPISGKAVADACVKKFFSTTHTLWPILDPDQFSHTYEDFYRKMGTNDATAAALIFAIIALGSDSRDVFDANLNASYGLLNQLIARPYLATVQSFILLFGIRL